MSEKKEEELKKIKFSSLKKAFKLFSFLLPYQRTYWVGMVMLVFSTLSTLAFPVLIGEMIKVLEGHSQFTLNQVAGIFAMVLVFQGIVSYFRIVLFSIVSEKATADIRKIAYKKMITSPISFFENNRVGDLISRLSSDISAIQNVLTTTVAEFLRQIITLVLGLAYLLFLSWKLTLFMLATFPITILAAMIFGRYVRKFSKVVQAKLAEASIIVDESLQSVATVKAYTNEKLEYKRYSNIIEEAVSLSIKLAKYRGTFVTFFIVGLFGGICLVIWFGGNLILENQIHLADLTTFLLQSLFIAGSLAGLGEIYTSLQRSIGASERILEILDEPSEIEIGQLTEEKRFFGEIAYKNVSFSYPSRPDVEVLKNISLEIPSGTKIALVGHSGAGKSTIIQLLMRFYQPNSGQINIDNQNIADLDISLLRKNIAIVPQEVLLFGGTILENIVYGLPSASLEQVKVAAKKANALDFIENFPEGFETIVGERGVKLSGGQKQRIAIARAILKDPAILILDEATSALDSESEGLIQEALDELMENRTSIIIAHRLATIKSVDKVYVLNKGEIEESGTHESLMLNENGTYKRFVKLQLEALQY